MNFNPNCSLFFCLQIKITRQYGKIYSLFIDFCFILIVFWCRDVCRKFYTIIFFCLENSLRLSLVTHNKNNSSKFKYSFSFTQTAYWLRKKSIFQFFFHEIHSAYALNCFVEKQMNHRNRTNVVCKWRSRKLACNLMRVEIASYHIENGHLARIQSSKWNNLMRKNKFFPLFM